MEEIEKRLKKVEDELERLQTATLTLVKGQLQILDDIKFLFTKVLSANATERPTIKLSDSEERLYG